MQMRVHRLDQPQVELTHEPEIAVDLVQNRIDDQCLAALATGKQIGIGARNGIEQLTEDHDLLHIIWSRSFFAACHAALPLPRGAAPSALAEDGVEVRHRLLTAGQDTTFVDGDGKQRIGSRVRQGQVTPGKQAQE
ncbi:hypothetical protein [Mesorhizobium captivum]|uniref:hypothetical protein n=1 Tax=Mesorhizobium captivum TaxID=3072319 RepID=UPI003D311844